MILILSNNRNNKKRTSKDKRKSIEGQEFDFSRILLHTPVQVYTKTEQDRRVLNDYFKRDPTWSTETIKKVSKLTGICHTKVYKWGYDKKNSSNKKYSMNKKNNRSTLYLLEELKEAVENGSEIKEITSEESDSEAKDKEKSVQEEQIQEILAQVEQNKKVSEEYKTEPLLQKEIDVVNNQEKEDVIVLDNFDQDNSKVVVLSSDDDHSFCSEKLIKDQKSNEGVPIQSQFKFCNETN